jgi:hypothetical protein
MRCTQYVGLSIESRVFLDENANKIGESICPHCGSYTREKFETINNGRFVCGMFGEELSLTTFRLKNGRVAMEVIQEEPWSSGPVIFTCLEVDGVRVAEWSQEDMDKKIG